MKLSLLPLLFAASALAQNYQAAFITKPSSGQTIASGKKFNVTVNSPSMLSSIEYVRVIISMKGCEVDPCTDYVDNPLVSQNVLYDGAFTPTHMTPGSSGVSQTFTLTAPQYGNGPAKIFVIHRYNIGASRLPQVEFINNTVTITGGPY